MQTGVVKRTVVLAQLEVDATEVFLLRRGLEHGLGDANEEMRQKLRNQLTAVEDALTKASVV